MGSTPSSAVRPRLSREQCDVLQKIADILLRDDQVGKLAKIPELLDDALALAVARGVVMYPSPCSKAHAHAVPVALLPAPVAEDLYDELKSMGPAFQEVQDRVVLDLPWMTEALRQVCKRDEICRRLVEICERVYGDGKKDLAQDIRLHITRNDFMLDTKVGADGFSAKQIELNMIAVSFSAHCQDLTEVHRYLLTKYLHRLDPELLPDAVAPVLDAALPRSPNVEGIAAGLAEAHGLYSARWRPTGMARVVLFVSDEHEKNELDHRKLEAALFEGHGVLSLRRSLSSLASGAQSLWPHLAPSSGSGHCAQPTALLVDGHEVSVVYFRSGYWPGQFEPAEACWQIREDMERAEAVKCPSAPAQLSGMKKVQQLLCEHSQLQRFAEPGIAECISRTFAQQIDPSAYTEEAKSAVQAAMKEPSGWVMKPQVEGSGDLLFGEDISRALQAKSKEELAEFILMERIMPAVTPSAVFSSEEGKRAEVAVRRSVSELGIFGTFVADGAKIVRNETFGHLLRSKASDTSQGGVFVGNAVVDAPLLVPPAVFWPKVSA